MKIIDIIFFRLGGSEGFEKVLDCICVEVRFVISDGCMVFVFFDCG